MSITKVFANQSANGNSDSVAVQTKGIPAGTEKIAVLASGTFDTSTLTVELTPDQGGIWIPTSYTLTAAGTLIFDAHGTDVRLALSSVGGSTDVDAWIEFR